jgi:quercetin dioxygenase-like cupin family protein
MTAMMMRTDCRLYESFLRTAACLLLVGMILPACGGEEEGGDETEAPSSDPAPSLAALQTPYATTVFDTSFARVHRVELPPGERIPLHQGGPRVVYSRSASRLQVTEAGRDTVRSFDDGALHFHASGAHAVENVGADSALYLVFERTEAALGGSEPKGPLIDAVSLEAGAESAVRLINDQVTVHHVRLAPGARLPEHFGYPRIVYALSESRVAMQSGAEEEPVERVFEAGQIHAHAAGRHQVENVGSGPAEYLVVAFKK